jgi:hypothetical protein
VDDPEVPGPPRHPALLGHGIHQHFLATADARPVPAFLRPLLPGVDDLEAPELLVPGTSSSTRTAAVPGRGEYMNTNTPSKATSSTRSTVSWNS